MTFSTGSALRKLPLGLLTLVLFASPAAAADPIAVANEIVAALSGGTRTATYAQATAVGEVVTVTGIVITDVPNDNDGDVAEIIVTNPIMRPTGGLTSEHILLRNGRLRDDAYILRFDTVELTGVVLPPVANVAAEGGPEMPVTGLIADHITFGLPEADPLVIERAEMRLGDIVEGIAYAVSVGATGVALPLSLLGESQIVQIIHDLGYDTLFLDVNAAGGFDARADTVTLTSVALAIRDFGRIDIGGILTGLPLGILQEPGGPELLLAGAMINNARIRFENGGAMEAFLTTQARLTNVQPQDVAFGLAAAFQIFLRVLENPTLERQVGQAVGAFLRNPQTLTIVADPEAPVPVMEIIGLLASNPTLIPALLNILITAND